MRNSSRLFSTILFLMASGLMLGCSDDTRTDTKSEAEGDVETQVEIEAPAPGRENPIEIMQSSMKASKEAATPENRIHHLRTFHDTGIELEGNWPDTKQAQTLRMSFEKARTRIPAHVMRQALQADDLDSFKWAVARTANEDISYDDKVQIWDKGKYWRDPVIEAHPEDTLSIFMYRAMVDYSPRFFTLYLPQFAASGYKAAYPLQQAELNTEFCRFYDQEIKGALRYQDVERIEFLLKYMPAVHEMNFIDNKQFQHTMESLTSFVISDLQDEKMLLRLIELGYAIPTQGMEQLPAGEDIYRALLADPESAITVTLKLDKWHGPLSANERNFVYNLSDKDLQLIHPTHLNEAIAAAIKMDNTEQAMRLIPIREAVQKMEPFEYDRLLGLALIYENDAVDDYVSPKCRQVNIYRLELDELGANWPLFRRLEPRIFRRIYPTMDTQPKKDGTTLGRIDALLRSHNPEAVLYVVKKHNLDRAWNKLSQDGRTVLMSVCEGGNLEAVQYLIEKKNADIHAQTDFKEVENTTFGSSVAKEGGLTPLSFAAQGGYSETISYLVSKNADVNEATYFGITPLMYAVGGNHLDAARVLLESGANVNASLRMSPRRSTHAEDLRRLSIRAGDTAYTMALARKNHAMITLLKEAGATAR